MIDVEGKLDTSVASLSELAALIQLKIERSAVAHRRVVRETDRLHEAVKENDVSTAIAGCAALGPMLSAWHNAVSDLSSQLVAARSILLDALDHRYDMGIEAVSADAGSLLGTIEQIEAYDLEKANTLKAITDLQREVAGIRLELEPWTNERWVVEALEAVQFLVDDHRTLTLQELQEQRRHLSSGRSKLGNILGQVREKTANRARELAAQYIEVTGKSEVEVTTDYVVSDLLSLATEVVSSQLLRQLETSIADLVEDHYLNAHNANPLSQARQLQENWNWTVATELLGALASEDRNAETLLLLVASLAAHPPTSTIRFERGIVASILRGLVELSGETNPLVFATTLVEPLVQGWIADDSQIQTELQILLLSLTLYGPTELPEGLLWQFPSEWPEGHMTEWNRLWNAVLFDEEFGFADEVLLEKLDRQLRQARSEVEKWLKTANGTFVRVNMPSRRHSAMMQELVMPYIAGLFATVEAFEPMLASLSEFEVYEVSRWYRKLEEAVKTTEDALSSASLEQLYLQSVRTKDVSDRANPFHRQKCENLMDNSAQAILDYAGCLKEMGKLTIDSQGKLRLSALRSEIGAFDTVGQITRMALEWFTTSPVLQEKRQKHEMHERSSRIVVDTLLSSARLILRHPHTVAQLVRDQPDWKDVLNPLLNDLGSPLSFTEAAQYLLEAEAPSQVLTVAKYLPQELQIEARELRDRLYGLCEHARSELIEANGNPVDISDDVRLGRWPLARAKLARQQEELQRRQEVAEREQAENQRRIMRLLNKLDEDCFGLQQQISRNAYALITDGLDQCRSAVREYANVEAVEAFIDVLNYRLGYRSWELTGLQQAYDQLRTRLQAGVAGQEIQELTLEYVLSRLEHGEIAQLGFRAVDGGAIPSYARTRAEFLHHVLEMRSQTDVQATGLNSSELRTLDAMFKGFARLANFRQLENINSQSYDTGLPLLHHSNWRLIHPKTYELARRSCIFVAVPGKPPSSKSINTFIDVVEFEEWFEEGQYFIFLFVPGCTSKMRTRLENQFPNHGLVILDEDALLDLVLAEPRGASNPVGRLRPKMLNALQADDIEVFTVHQLVREKSSIFVGRKRLIERLVNSAHNFGIYGGRRIGKSSVLAAVEDRLALIPDVTTVFYSFEGDEGTDDVTARKLGVRLGLTMPGATVSAFKDAVQSELDANPELSYVLLLDEVDRYIQANPNRHRLIETFRTLSDRYERRFRVIVAGFMDVYKCLSGKGPYSPSSDPWVRIFHHDGPLGNLKAEDAERIVREGFIEILGWTFDSSSIPQRVVELTGGHPAFVQYFCYKLQQLVGARGNRLITLDDLNSVFNDNTPTNSFIAHVSMNMTMNLNNEPLSQFLIYWIAVAADDLRTFTFREMRDIVDELVSVEIDDSDLLNKVSSLELNSVIRQIHPGVYEFTVPDYPLIIKQFGEVDQDHLDMLIAQLEESNQPHE